MVNLIIRIVVNAVALVVAAWVVPGLAVTSDVLGLLLVAIVFGLVNAIIKPIVAILTCPLTIVTLGLFTLVLNALMLMLTAWLTEGLAIEGALGGFIPALFGGIIIGIVSTVLSWFLPDNRD